MVTTLPTHPVPELSLTKLTHLWLTTRQIKYMYMYMSCEMVCGLVFFDSVPCYWGVESGQVDLVSGQGHTNVVCSLHATPETLLSLGLDKNLKTTQLATNEFRYHPSLVLS